MKAFAKVRAVDGVDLAVGAGERVALLGPNGAGKTTTLLMLLGAITPDAGSITIVGHQLPAGPIGGDERGRLRGRLPAAPRSPPGERGAVDLRRLLRHGPQGRRRRGRDGPRAVRDHAPGRPHVHGAVVGPAHPRRHREGDPPRPPAPRARRAHGQPRPRRRLPGAHRSARRRRQRRHRPARHQPQHGRGGAPVRAGRVPRRRPGGGRRLARARSPTPSATATSRACSSTSPARSSPRTRSRTSVC